MMYHKFDFGEFRDGKNQVKAGHHIIFVREHKIRTYGA